MSTASHACIECQTPISARRGGKLFCSTVCRQTFNNRRMQRGSDLYDLFRALRRERDQAKALNLWTLMCRIEKQWQDEDDRTRPGRRSYVPPVKAITNLMDKGALRRGEILVR
jgi:hypothetical protein